MTTVLKQPKTWHKFKILDTYEAAAAVKAELMCEDPDPGLEVKIKRCGPEGTQFKVKTHRPKTNINKRVKE